MCCITQYILWSRCSRGKPISPVLSNNLSMFFRLRLRYLNCCPIPLRISFLLLFFFFARLRYCFLAKRLYVRGLCLISSSLHSSSISLSLSSLLRERRPRSVGYAII